MKHAFTLIELLVVIAIIAILAAILFPVFAQAKVAAKKVASLSNVKQIGLSSLMYSADFDDLYPLSKAHLDGEEGWQDPGTYVRFPWDWRDPSLNPRIANASQSVWANALLAYTKSIQVFQNSSATIYHRSGVDYSQKSKEPGWTNYYLNGSLSEYSVSAVASPSRLIAYWQGFGHVASLGYADSNPILNCPDGDLPCRYVPPSSTCGEGNGEYSWLVPAQSGLDGPTVDGWLMAVQWVHGRGSNFSYADGSAKFQTLGGNLGGFTDYKRDPFWNYSANGVANGMWADTYYCHYPLFSPDFDFENWGEPVPEEFP